MQYHLINNEQEAGNKVTTCTRSSSNRDETVSKGGKQSFTRCKSSSAFHAPLFSSYGETDSRYLSNEAFHPVFSELAATPGILTGCSTATR